MCVCVCVCVWGGGGGGGRGGRGGGEGRCEGGVVFILKVLDCFEIVSLAFTVPAN